MKKKKLLAALAAAAVLAIGGGVLAGCETQHTHTYSTDWEKDATGHWHVATCDDLKEGDEGYTKDFEAHVWGDDDECDVCHYKKTPDNPDPPPVTEYTVKLDANGGTLAGGKETVDVKTKDGKIESLPTPTAPEGMEFVGWFTEDVAGAEVTTQTAFKANATVYAHYVSVCTVTLNAGAGTLDTKTLKATDGKIEELPTPAAPAGKQFVGWFTAAEGGKEVTVATPFDEDTTIYAQYVSVYTITLNVGEDGALPAGALATLTTKGGKIETLPTPVTANAATAFIGWFTAAEGGEQVTVDTVFTGDVLEITLYARYRQEIAVTFNVGSGTLPEGVSATAVTTNNKLAELPVPVAATNKWFKGWYTAETDGVKISSTIDLSSYATANALTLYARYVEEVTITLDKGDEGTLPAGTVTTYKTVGGKIVLPEGQRGLPAVTTDKEHWVFFGWFDKTSPLGTPVNIETAVFEKDTTLTAKVGCENGVWVGDTFINTLTLNPGASRTEYWLGGGKITLKKGDVMSLYMNGDLIKHYVEGNSAGIDKPNAASQVTTVTVSVAGEFAIYLHKNAQDWSCEYSGPTEINVGSEVPYGCDSVTITIGSNAPITFFVKDTSGNGVGKADFSKYCIYTFTDEIFGAWASSTTQGRLKEEITVSAAAVPSGWIFRWGSGYGSQTVNIVGAFKAGKTYLVELKGHQKAAVITELTITSVYTITLDQNYAEQPETKLTAKAYNGKLTYLPTFTLAGNEDKDLYWYTEKTGGEKVTLNTVFSADATIYARWEDKIVATVDENYTGKPENTTVSLDHGKFTTLPVAPTRDDYDFVGWFTAATEGEEVTLDTEFTQNATIYAQWKAKIVITVDQNYTGKDDNTTVKANNGKLKPLPTAPTRDGYEFIGWYTEAEGGTRVSISTVFTENSTIYAQWRVPFKVTLNYNYKDCPEAEVKTAKVVSGATYSRLPVADIITPEREGYEFLGWYSNEDGTGTRLAASTSITEDTTYYASWKVPFKVTLILNYDGAPAAVVRTAKTVVGQTYSRLSAEDLVVDREGYDVTGWYPNADGTGTKLTTRTNISADVTYYAQWKEAYKVTLDLNYEGAPAALEKWAKLVINQTFSRVPAEDIVTPEREGYNFLGWYANANGSGETLTANTTITSSRTYYARWQKKYEVTFNLNYEGCGDPIVMLTEKVSGVTYGKISNPPTPTREGYEFVGWFDTAEETGGTALNANRITADGTYYARWTPVTEPTPTPEEQA